jgi:hypothetical protein
MAQRSFLKVPREESMILHLDTDSTSQVFPRLWSMLDLHSTAPLAIDIRIESPVLKIAVTIKRPAKRAQEQLLRDLRRIMAIRRATILPADRPLEPMPPQYLSEPAGTAGASGSAMRRLILNFLRQ